MAAKPSVRSPSRPRPPHLTSRRGFGCGNCTASSPQPLRCRVAPSGRVGSTRLRLGVPGLRQLHLGLSIQKAGLRAGLGSALWRTGGSGAAGRARGPSRSSSYAARTTHAHLAPRRRQARLCAARGPRATQTLRPVSSASGRSGPERQVCLSPAGICRLGGTRGRLQRDYPQPTSPRPPLSRDGGEEDGAWGWGVRGHAASRWTFGDRDPVRGRPAQPGRRMCPEKGWGGPFESDFSPV